MKTSDYIVGFLVKGGIVHCYGYQGTMIAHLVDSICNEKRLINHVCYNEQGAAFAAVGQAKATGKATFAYATSGPGAANLISGIADAYYDSVPVLFITGQLNTYEYQDVPGLKQHGFQEMNITDMVKPIVKYCAQVRTVEELPETLNRAYQTAVEGRPGPVLIDLPMDMQRMEIDQEPGEIPVPGSDDLDADAIALQLTGLLKEAERPVLLLGNGIRHMDRDILLDVIDRLGVPVITSMPGRDILPYAHPLNYGYIGYGYGHRYANMIAHKKADLILALGCSLCRRQTGMKTDLFAKDARIVRVDIDRTELERKVHQDDVAIHCDCREVIRALSRIEEGGYASDQWLSCCSRIKEILEEYDRSDINRRPNQIIQTISQYTKRAGTVVCDVGQHQVWGAQSYELEPGQKMLFSGGHGAMGFSLPAAIGACYGTGRPVITITGDGSMQMNIQELQWIRREQVPVTVFVMNNRALGLIHQQQDSLFDGRYYSSVDTGGYLVPDFCDIARGYHINAFKVEDPAKLTDVLGSLDLDKPNLVEIILPEDSRACPKTAFGNEMHNQEPLMPADLLEELLEM